MIICYILSGLSFLQLPSWPVDIMIHIEGDMWGNLDYAPATVCEGTIVSLRIVGVWAIDQLWNFTQRW